MARSRVDETTKWFQLAQLTAASQEYLEMEASLEAAKYKRDETIRRAKRSGLSLQEIGNIMGLSKARIQQIVPGAEEDDEPTPDQQAV